MVLPISCSCGCKQPRRCDNWFTIHGKKRPASGVHNDRPIHRKQHNFSTGEYSRHIDALPEDIFDGRPRIGLGTQLIEAQLYAGGSYE
jgi:hypothetical protein